MKPPELYTPCTRLRKLTRGTIRWRSATMIRLNQTS
ncbi:hypothetical protein BH23GEM6_BH23GEM6_25580 [soil metagenome]